MVLSILVWWLVVQILGLAGLPLAAWLFRAMPDRGYAQAKALGLLATGYGAWLLAMLGLAPFGTGLLLVIGALFGGLGWYGMRGRGLIAWLRANWRLILGYELVFLAALVFVALLRSTTLSGVIDPDPFGTERPMDFAFFNAIQRSPTFPPHDPWLSGYSINYYYFGYLLMASVALLSGLPSATAYNLSLALCFALAAVGIAGVIWNMIALATTRSVAPDVPIDEAAEAIPERKRRRIWLAPLVIAVTLIAILVGGNLAGAAQVILGDEKAVALDTQQFFTAAQQALAGRTTVYLPTPLITDEFKNPDGTNYITQWERKPADQSFSSWWTSRTLWDEIPAAGVRRYAITEFPAFSFMLGDMHPHVLALPFGVLAIALALSVLARPTVPFYAQGRGGWADLLLTGLVLGCLYVINTWDMPGYMLLYAAALALLAIRLAGGVRGVIWPFVGRNFLYAIGMSLVLFIPFYMTFRSFAGTEPDTNIPILRSISGVLGLLTTDRSQLHAFFLIFGVFLLPVVGVILGQWRGLRRAPAPVGIVAQQQKATGGITFDALLGLGPFIIGGALLLGLLFNFQLLFLLPLGLYALGLAYYHGENRGLSFGLLAASIGCFICFGTEIIYIRDVFEGWQPRFNTIFKFYYQVWLVWGIVSGFGLWWLYHERFSLRRPGGYLFSALFGLLLLGALVYPQHTAWRALTEGQRTGLEGHTRRDSTPAGAAAIAWLRTQTQPGAVVLEAVGGSYDTNGDGAAQVSAASGLPTVLGWPGHESQWRNGNPELLAQLSQRETDIDTIYRTGDTNAALELLNKYTVRYIYVGDFERRKYADAPDGLAKFNTMNANIKVAFQNEEVTIYEVVGG